MEQNPAGKGDSGMLILLAAGYKNDCLYGVFG